MKKILTIGLIGLTLLVFPTFVFADFMSVSADLPVSYSPSGDAEVDGMPTGIKLGVSFVVIPVGVGFENYTVKYKGDSNQTVTMYDLFFNLPIPVINIAAGVGFGNASLDVAGAEDTSLYQVFASLGYNIIPLLDIHVGLHNISATDSENSDAGATMISMGVKVGF
ncbi:hypothetical protein WDW89_05675 [Deltaproteobacteria bacterium TL4]